MMQAFHDSTDTRDALVRRLATHAEAGRLVFSATQWSGEQGSLVGCLLESPDVSQWKPALGLPSWLALAADDLAANHDSAKSAAAFGTAMLQAIRPGVNLEPVGSRFILALLHDLKITLGAVPEPGVAAQAFAEVEQLHRNAATGAPAPAPQWRAARRAATQAADATSDEPLRALLECAATAAWDPATSPVVVCEVLRNWLGARIRAASVNAGYGSDYDSTVKARLQQLFDAYLADKPELQETLTVFELMEEHYPDEARRLREKNELDGRAYGDAYTYAATSLLALLKAA